MNSDTVKTVKRAVPLGVFCVAGWYTYQKRENIQESIIFGGIVALIAYLIAGPLIDKLVSLSERPSEGSYETKNIPQGWNPESLARELQDDILGVSWGVANRANADVYRRVAALNDDQLVAIYNYWRSHSFGEKDESLTKAMAGEFYGVGQTGDYAKNIISRLKSRQCY